MCDVQTPTGSVRDDELDAYAVVEHRLEDGPRTRDQNAETYFGQRVTAP
jgi:hypothetical protein